MRWLRIGGIVGVVGFGLAKTSGVFFIHPISYLTFMLTRRVDSPGLDLTGLAGIYDFRIDLSGLGFNGNPPLKERTVLQFSRRFKMTFHKAEGAKHPVEILGIDHVERTPKEN